MVEPSDNFVQYIQKLEKGRTGKDISLQEAWEGANNLLGFFDLLLKIDKRNELNKKENKEYVDR